MSTTFVSIDGTSRTEAYRRGQAGARGDAYWALGRLLGPTAGWVDDFESLVAQALGSPYDSLRGVADDVSRQVAAASLDSTSADVAQARLFLGPFELLVSPYASTYLEHDGRLMGEVSAFVAELYAEAGIGPGVGPREVPDHVCCELELMYYLAYKEASAADGPWRVRQGRFFDTHLGLWAPRFARELAASRAHPLYTDVGRYLVEFLAAEAEVFASEPPS